MINVKATNFMGESLVLSPAEDKYAIVKISGLSPQGGTISTQKMAQHGSEFINATTDERNIIIDLRILGDVEENREALNAAFPPGLPVDLTFETYKKTACITGYTEENDQDWFTQQSSAQISIICPDPFFYAPTAKEYEAGAEPIAVNSSCPFPTGYGVRVQFDAVADGFTLRNETTGEELKIAYVFLPGDTLLIDTEERTVSINGNNAYNSKVGSWALLRRGENQFTATDPATIIHKDRYIGI